MKIGSSTISIKPATPTPAEVKSVVVTTNDPPPLAPLSIQSNKAGMKTITLTPNSADGSKVLVSPSQKITANKMLVDLLDKKAPEPPVFGGTTIKRKIDMESEVPAKKSDTEEQPAVTPSPKAADLYAKLAGSILDSDEEMEDELEKIPTKVIEKKVVPAPQVISSTPRQIIVGPNNQMILSPQSGSHQTATIKTDSGIQTVPIILQNNAIQGIPGQTIIQQPAPTQYILATNQQGQTYVVAQQPMPQPQQILLAQTPNQQGTKTIIILQQGQGQQQQIQVAQPQQQQQQKIIMTPNGQQVIYSTQRQVIGQQQVIGNYQQNTTQPMANRKIVFTNTPVDGQTTPGGAKIIQQQIVGGQNIIVQKGQKFQIGNTQISQVIQPPKTQVPMKVESPPVQVTAPSKSPSPVAQPEVKANETQEIQETVETPKESPKESPSTSGTSSPAPGKQQVSIQIPVPQSQVGGPNSQQYSIKIIPSMDPAKVKDEEVDASWPFVCDWRGCPKKKFANANEVYLHACAVHCPSIDGTPDMFCQWGGGNSLCDNLPRKRFSLMTHIFDRHCTAEAFKMAVQKRMAATENAGPKQPYPVTLVRQPNSIQANEAQNVNLINGPTNIQNAGAAAMQAIKRHSIEFNIAKEQMVRKMKGVGKLMTNRDTFTGGT
jgi:AT-rich interactive domain-containing protein 2